MFISLDVNACKQRMKRTSWTQSFPRCLLVISLCCFAYLSGSAFFFANARHPSALTYYERQLHKDIDVVGIAVKPTCVTKRAIEALNEFFGPRRVIVVTTSAKACQKFCSFGKNVECLTETGLLPGVSKDAIRQFLEQTYSNFDGKLFRGRDLSGWYLQQFLKLGAMLYVRDLSKYHVIWDLDMILLRDLSIFHDSSEHGRQVVINIGGFNSPGYDYSYRNLTGDRLKRASDGTSFVTHWIVVYKPYMKEYITYLSSRPSASNTPDGSPWVWAVLSALNPNHLHMGFSEYASYCNWVLKHHPEFVYEMPRKTWTRHPFGSEYGLSLMQRLSENGLCCPTEFVIGAMTAAQYQYSGFEAGHSEKCNYNDPKFKDGYGV